MTEMMKMDTVDTQLDYILVLCIITHVRPSKIIDTDVLFVKRQVISLASKVVPLLISVLCNGVCEHTFLSTDDHHDGWVRYIPVVFHIKSDMIVINSIPRKRTLTHHTIGRNHRGNTLRVTRDFLEMALLKTMQIHTNM